MAMALVAWCCVLKMTHWQAAVPLAALPSTQHCLQEIATFDLPGQTQTTRIMKQTLETSEKHCCKSLAVTTQSSQLDSDTFQVSLTNCLPTTHPAGHLTSSRKWCSCGST
jgi:hypothetical protein